MATVSNSNFSQTDPLPRTGAGWAELNQKYEGEYEPIISERVDEIACYVLMGLGVCLLLSPFAIRYGAGILNGIANTVSLGHAHANLALTVSASTTATALVVTLPVAGIMIGSMAACQFAGVFNDRARLDYDMKVEEKKKAEEEEETKRQEKEEKEWEAQQTRARIAALPKPPEPPKAALPVVENESALLL